MGLKVLWPEKCLWTDSVSSSAHDSAIALKTAQRPNKVKSQKRRFVVVPFCSGASSSLKRGVLFLRLPFTKSTSSSSRFKTLPRLFINKRLFFGVHLNQGQQIFKPCPSLLSSQFDIVSGGRHFFVLNFRISKKRNPRSLQIQNSLYQNSPRLIELISICA